MEPKKMGRPPKSEAEKRQQIGVRTSPELKERLESAAAANGRSVAQEAEFRLAQSFDADDLMGGEATRSLLVRVAGDIARVERVTGKSWMTDIETFVAARQFAEAAISQVMPLPDDFFVGQILNREIKAIEQERRVLFDVLAECGVVTRTLASLMPGGSTDFHVMPEEQWTDHMNRPLDDNGRAFLKEKLAELRGKDAEIAGLKQRRDIIGDPVKDAIGRGVQLHADLKAAESLIGGENGAEI